MATRSMHHGDEPIGSQQLRVDESQIYQDEIPLIQCRICLKKFSQDRIAVHERVCNKRLKDAQKKSELEGEGDFQGKQKENVSQQFPIPDKNLAEQIRNTEISLKDAQLLGIIDQQQTQKSIIQAQQKKKLNPLQNININDDESGKVNNDEEKLMQPPQMRVAPGSASIRGSFFERNKPQLVQCEICGRNFSTDRIETHQTICQQHPPSFTVSNQTASIVAQPSAGKQRDSVNKPVKEQVQTKRTSVVNAVGDRQGSQQHHQPTPASARVSSSDILNSSIGKRRQSVSQSVQHQQSIPTPAKGNTAQQSKIQHLNDILAQTVSVPQQGLITTSTSKNNNISSNSSSIQSLTDLMQPSLPHKRKRSLFKGLVIFTSPSMTKKSCIGEVIYEEESTVIEELPLLIEEQLGINVDLSQHRNISSQYDPESDNVNDSGTMWKNGFIPIHSSQFNILVKDYFSNPADSLCIRTDNNIHFTDYGNSAVGFNNINMYKRARIDPNVNIQSKHDYLDGEDNDEFSDLNPVENNLQYTEQ